MNTVQEQLIDKLIGTLMANVEEGKMEDAAALLMHAGWVAEVALEGQQK